MNRNWTTLGLQISGIDYRLTRKVPLASDALSRQRSLNCSKRTTGGLVTLVT